MQKYKELATKLFENRNKNFSVFAQTSNTLQMVEDLSPKSYYETYFTLYQGSKLFALLSQVATAVSSYTFFAALLAIKVSSEYLPFVVCFVLILIEILKYLTLKTALKSFFALPPTRNYVLLGFAVLLSAISIYASIQGSANLAIDNTKIESENAKYESDILAVKNEIQGITNRNSWKGKVYLPKDEKALLHQKEAKITALETEKQDALRSISDTQERQATQFQFGFAFFDLLFILCSLYGFHFSRCVVLEEKANQLDNSTPVSVTPLAPVTNQISHDVASQDNEIPNSTRGNPIGFTFSNLNKKVVPDENSINENHKELNTTYINHIHYNRKCLHCGNDFLHNHKKQKFCADKCRVAAWEQKTKRILKFKTKKGNVSYKQNTLF
jgi:ribosomal protein S27AE